MARRHGRNSRIYLGLTSAGTAEPIMFQAKWTIDFSVDFPEVTAFGDTNKVRVAGLPDAKGTFTGFYDDVTVETYTAATDGVARKWYLYPDIVNDPAQYWFGTIFADFHVDGDVAGSLATSANWVAASSITKVG
jgi:hypothetical protein